MLRRTAATVLTCVNRVGREASRSG
jgi:hypothetical protein